MRYLFLLLALSFSLSSCVTIFNGNTTQVHVHADKRAEIIYNKQYPDVTYSAHYMPAETDDTSSAITYGDVSIQAKRSQGERLSVLLVKDGVEKKIAIKPVHSWLYYANIYPLWGLGFLLDCNNPNRFTYPHHVYVDMNDNAPGRGYSVHKPFTSAKLEWTINPPLINGYVLGFNYLSTVYSPLGLSTGLNYHYSRHSFLSVEIGTAALNTGRRRFHRPDDSLYFLYHSGYPKEYKRAIFFTAMNNHVFGRFDVGYGLMVGEHSGYRRYERYKMYDTTLYSADYVSLGCSFSAHYRISNSFFAGFNYQPQFMMLGDDTKVLYEHLFNFGFSWRVGLLRNKFYVYK